MGERLSIPDLAAEFGMAHSTFRRHFNEWTHITPGDYRVQQCLQEAQRQLSSGHISITQIADGLGYPDLYTFSKQFKKFICPPSPRLPQAIHVEGNAGEAEFYF